jgi:ApaG protein
MFSEVVTSRTKDVIVSVQTAYVPAQSNPGNDQYVFAYRITITNDSTETVQLLRRHWIITDAYGRKRKVDGDGVVGLQPILSPGQVHEYVSGCDFQSPVGQMRGNYDMVSLDSNAAFKVRIPTFTMVCPIAMN